jgi:hypothetical protein
LTKLSQFIQSNFEKIFILVSIFAASFITYFVPNNISFLNFFFLPIILAGYYVGIRLSVPGAVFCLGVVLFHAAISPEQYQPPQDVEQVVAFVLTWGCFLVLAGALVGKQQEKIIHEREGLERLNIEVFEAYEKPSSESQNSASAVTAKPASTLSGSARYAALSLENFAERRLLTPISPMSMLMTSCCPQCFTISVKLVSPILFF